MESQPQNPIKLATMNKQNANSDEMLYTVSTDHCHEK